MSHSGAVTRPEGQLARARGHGVLCAPSARAPLRPSRCGGRRPRAGMGPVPGKGYFLTVWLVIKSLSH
jgi:hypothetical protein